MLIIVIRKMVMMAEGGAGGERKRIPPAWKTERQERTERINELGV